MCISLAPKGTIGRKSVWNKISRKYFIGRCWTCVPSPLNSWPLIAFQCPRSSFLLSRCQTPPSPWLSWKKTGWGDSGQQNRAGEHRIGQTCAIGSWTSLAQAFVSNRIPDPWTLHRRLRKAHPEDLQLSKLSLDGFFQSGRHSDPELAEYLLGHHPTHSCFHHLLLRHHAQNTPICHRVPSHRDDALQQAYRVHNFLEPDASFFVEIS